MIITRQTKNARSGLSPERAFHYGKAITINVKPMPTSVPFAMTFKACILTCLNSA